MPLPQPGPAWTPGSRAAVHLAESASEDTDGQGQEARAGSPAASSRETAAAALPSAGLRSGSGQVRSLGSTWESPKGLYVSGAARWELGARQGQDRWLERLRPALSPQTRAGGVAPGLTRWYAGGRGRWPAGRGHRCPQTSAAGTPRSRAWLAALRRLSGPGAHLLQNSRRPCGWLGHHGTQGHRTWPGMPGSTGISPSPHSPEASRLPEMLAQAWAGPTSTLLLPRIHIRDLGGETLASASPLRLLRPLRLALAPWDWLCLGLPQQ